MDIPWQSVFNFLGVSVIPLIAVYLGWKLSQKSFIKQLLLNNLEQKVDALRQIKSVIEDIPPDLNKKELMDRLNSDSEFCSSLTSRLVRLVGLRNECIPFLTSEFIDLIDKRMKPLYIIGNGGYEFRKEKTKEFANFAEEAKLLVASIEEKLTQEHKNQLK